MSRWRSEAVVGRRGRWATGSPASSTAAAACRSGALLAGPVGWLVIGYLGSLALLLVAAFWTVDPLSGEVVKELQPRKLRNPRSTNRSTATIVGRTVLIAALVTLTDAVLAFPIAFYMAKVASRRGKAILVVAVLLPLWSSYLVKVYCLADDALRPDGVDQLGAGAARPARPGLRQHRGLAGDELPLAAVHDPADLRRAGADPELADQRLRGPRRLAVHDLPAGDPAARLPRRRRRLDLHLLADPRRLHHAASWSPTTSSSATSIFNNITNNLPFASALALVPIVVMIAYLLVARKLGAFEHV